jgi:hypothetical protein
LPGGVALGTEPADLAQWKHFAHLTLTRSDWRKQLSAHRLRPGFADPGVRARLKELIEDLKGIAGAREELLELRRAPAANLAADDAAAIAALSRVLSRAAAELHAAFAEAGRVDYTYVTGAARAALAEGGEPTDLALRTGLALRHILVDEFQDTSLSQVQLLEALTVGWEEGDGRTLFVSGIRCSRSTASATRRWGSFCGRAPPASAGCACSRCGCCAISAPSGRSWNSPMSSSGKSFLPRTSCAREA